MGTKPQLSPQLSFGLHVIRVITSLMPFCFTGRTGPSWWVSFDFSRYLALFAFVTCAFAQSWTQLSPTGAPPVARTGATAVYDPATYRMILFGGRDANGNNHNDVWVLTHATGLGNTGQWIRLVQTRRVSFGSPISEPMFLPWVCRLALRLSRCKPVSRCLVSTRSLFYRRSANPAWW